MSRLIQDYKDRIVPHLQSALGRTNVHSLPRLTKIVVSMGVGKAVDDRKRLDVAAEHLTRLYADGQVVPLGSRAFDVLAAIVEAGGERQERWNDDHARRGSDRLSHV